MDLVKAKEIMDIIEKLDHNSNDAILEALRLAQHVEETSMDFYSAEVKKTKGTELEAFFAFLVKEEQMHLAKIMELQKSIKEDKLKQINFPRNVAPQIHSIPGGQDNMTAVLYGLWREKKAVEFYSGAALKTKGTVKKFFEELAEFEKGHVALFESLVEGSTNTDELIMG